MQRDMDLVRLILLEAESHPHGFGPSEIVIEGYSEEQIGYHIYIMGQAGLVESIDRTHMGSESPEASIKNLTWEGHDFLASAKSPDIWAQARQVLHRTGDASFRIWQSVLTDIIKSNLGVG